MQQILIEIISTEKFLNRKKETTKLASICNVHKIIIISEAITTRSIL